MYHLPQSEQRPDRLPNLPWVAFKLMQLVGLSRTIAAKIYFTSLFSAQTYSLICQSGFNLKILWAVQAFVYAFES